MAKNYECIAETTVGAGGTTNITFNSIPQTYTDLLIKFSLRNTLASNQDNINMTFNSTTTDYSDYLLSGGASYSRSSRSEVAYFYQNGANSTASSFSNGDVYIPNYSKSSTQRNVSIETSISSNSSTGCFYAIDGGLLQNTAAITSINFNSNNGTFVQYSKISLYGIKNS